MSTSKETLVVKLELEVLVVENSKPINKELLNTLLVV
jgi:hypothetical protein